MSAQKKYVKEMMSSTLTVPTTSPAVSGMDGGLLKHTLSENLWWLTSTNQLEKVTKHVVLSIRRVS